MRVVCACECGVCMRVWYACVRACDCQTILIKFLSLKYFYQFLFGVSVAIYNPELDIIPLLEQA